jgi:ribosome-associated translation inhibitor RaiA
MGARRVMQRPLEIHLHDIVPLPSLEPEIRRRVAKLEQWAADLVGCRFSLDAEANRHKQGHDYRITIEAFLPDGHLVVSHHHGTDALLALRAAFDAMDRKLDDRAQIRSREVKLHVDGRPPESER